MSTFADDFDRSFRDARKRVFSKADGRNSNGKTPDKSIVEATAEFTVDDFYAYMPQHSYIFAPTAELWPAPSVDARLPRQRLLSGKPMEMVRKQPETIQASRWLDKFRAVEQMTWAPGEPKVIEGRLVAEGGWIERSGCKVFNLYRPPKIVPKPGPVDQWIDLLHRLYGDDAEHIVRWLAHRVQRPGAKVNHALVFGGAQGIGKDTVLVPVKQAVGPWNFSEVSPQQMLGRFNGFLKSVICRVSEARDLGDVDRYAFYDHLKTYITAPPDVLRIDEKNLREYSVPNALGIILTSNHKTDGIYLPADDRRHFVAWSALSRDDFADEYWASLYRWYDNGGTEAVAAYLAAFDLSALIPTRPRLRLRRSGKLSMRRAHQRTPNSLTLSTRSARWTRSPWSKSPVVPPPPSANGYAIARMHAEYRIVWSLADMLPSEMMARKTAFGRSMAVGK
jgi:hypothetical protein